MNNSTETNFKLSVLNTHFDSIHSYDRETGVIVVRNGSQLAMIDLNAMPTDESSLMDCNLFDQSWYEKLTTFKLQRTEIINGRIEDVHSDLHTLIDVQGLALFLPIAFEDVEKLDVFDSLRFENARGNHATCWILTRTA